MHHTARCGGQPTPPALVRLLRQRPPAIAGTKALKDLKSVAEIGKEKGDVPLPENESVDPDNIIQLRFKGHAVWQH